MSLVNNMLRDLDQRRKESGGAGGSVKLMPASDIIPEGGSHSRFVIAALVVVVAALIYFWVTGRASVTEQQLDIRIDSRVAGSSADSARLIQELEESIVEAEQAALTQFQQAEPQSTNIQQDSQLLSQSTSQVAGISPEVNSVTESQPQPRIPSAEVSSAPVESIVIEEQTRLPVADPSLVRSGPVESVKEDPEYSNEQLDTIAVQNALRQIADGEENAAFQTLEQRISENFYAHQSRETFAKLLMSRGRVNDADALIDAGLALAPNHSGFKKVKARLLMADGQLSDAVSILMSRAPAVIDDPEYHDLLATAQLSSRDFSGAIISYTGLVQFDETQGKWWYGFAAAHDQLGNIQPARQAYSRAIQYGNLSANLRRRSQERLGALNP